MKTTIPDLSTMASEEVISRKIQLNGQQILFDKKVMLMPTTLEKTDGNE